MSNFFQGIKSFFSVTGKRWQSLSLFSRNLVINLFWGLSVVFVLWLFSDSPWLMEAEDASMDWLMRMEKNIIPSIRENNIPSVVVLDIDNQTFHHWGEPLFISRQRLINLIDAAVRAKARLVIVTLDVSQEAPVEGSQLHPDDEALKTYLANYIAKCQNEKKDMSACPPIILGRSFSAQSNYIPILQTGFLDEVVAQGVPYVQWASRQFYPVEHNVVRRWKLWQPVCTSDKQPMVVPSIELLAMSFVKENCITWDVQNVLQQLFQPKNCDNDITQLLHEESLELCDLPINTKDRWGINQRIMYRVPWLVNDYPPSLPYLVTDETGSQVLRTLSAQSFTESTPQARLKALANNVVVIGTSYHEGQDVHLTPLGDMPGTLVFVNALHSLLQYEKIDLHSIADMLTMMLLIVIMSIAIRIFPSFKGVIISGVLIIFGLLPLTMIIFHYGMWFNFALPLIVIIVYRLITEFGRPGEKKNQMIPRTV